MVRKGDQIIYKLPNNMQVSSIAEEQRQQLMNEIQSIHASTMAAAQQQQQQQPIAPRIPEKIPQPTPAEFDAMKETARNLREEFERQQQMRSDYDSDGNKTTRRYNKTGKYSKKRQLSQYSQQLQPNIIYNQQQPVSNGSSLSKRLPEEELQHREIKKRFKTQLEKRFLLLNNSI